MASILRLPSRPPAPDQRPRRSADAAVSGRAHAGEIVDALPCRCEKPHLPTRALARLIEEAEARLALAESRVGEALRAAWPVRRAEVPVLRPAPSLPAYARAAEGPMPNVVFALFGHGADGQRRAVEGVLREQRGAQPFVPIFLTNDPDFATFREARLVFEYFPFVLDEGARAAPTAWSAYLVEALQLSMRRWGVQRLVRI